jgi:hypothetical protein
MGKYTKIAKVLECDVFLPHSCYNLLSANTVCVYIYLAASLENAVCVLVEIF